MRRFLRYGLLAVGLVLSLATSTKGGSFGPFVEETPATTLAPVAFGEGQPLWVRVRVDVEGAVRVDDQVREPQHTEVELVFTGAWAGADAAALIRTVDGVEDACDLGSPLASSWTAVAEGLTLTKGVDVGEDQELAVWLSEGVTFEGEVDVSGRVEWTGLHGDRLENTAEAVLTVERLDAACPTADTGPPDTAADTGDTAR